MDNQYEGVLMDTPTDTVASEAPPPALANPPLWYRGLDLNNAEPAEISARLDGVGRTLALAIVQNRTVMGPFMHLRDLARVPGMGPRNFTRITGLAWRADGVARREQVMEILSPTEEGDLDLPAVTRRLAGTKGFTGCIITDQDGHLVASSWSDPKHEAMGAFAPYLFKKMAPSLQAVEAGDLDAVTLFAGERAFIMIPIHQLVLVAVQNANQFSRSHLRVVQQVADAINHLLFSAD